MVKISAESAETSDPSNSSSALSYSTRCLFRKSSGSNPLKEYLLPKVIKLMRDEVMEVAWMYRSKLEYIFCARAKNGLLDLVRKVLRIAKRADRTPRHSTSRNETASGETFLFNCCLLLVPGATNFFFPRLSLFSAIGPILMTTLFRPEFEIEACSFEKVGNFCSSRYWRKCRKLRSSCSFDA